MAAQAAVRAEDDDEHGEAPGHDVPRGEQPAPSFEALEEGVRHT
jgi:hypothetical protein